jgi:DNA polymerase/3'-5' exonuclease PolX
MNQTIVENLQKISDYEKSRGETFKHRAYQRAIQSIKSLSFDIDSIDDLKDVKHVGKGIRQKVEIIFDKGVLDLENDLPTSEKELVKQLLNIYGVGVKKANELKAKIKSLEELKENSATLLNQKQQIGLKHYAELQERIPRSEIEFHETYISQIWSKQKKPFEFRIVGSYRRGAPHSGDIDIMVTFNPPSRDRYQLLLRSLEESGYLVDHLAWGDKKYMGVCQHPVFKKSRRIDILYCSPAEYPYCLLYFTGSGEFNRKLREIANDNGYKLNEKKLIQLGDGEVVQNLRSEKEIMEFLGVHPYEPHERSDSVLG